ncbi:MAG: response regulator [Verrucomicrobia bacterium]|nr:response regulator [Verrucomicrobiota bacterium]
MNYPMSQPRLPVPSMSKATNGHAAFDLPKVNILIVDDRDDKLLALEAVISTLNENIVKARSGKEALRHLLQTDFAVILLDVAMPGMDGFETAALIRKRPQSELTPIIFVTSLNAAENQIVEGYSLGAVDYILSPIIPDVLKTKVSVFVELYKKTDQIKRQAERIRQIEQAEHKRQLAEAVDRLEMETQRNRFFTLSIDLLGIADFTGHFLQLNPTWEKILGFTEAELKSKSGFDLVHPEDHGAMCEQMKALQKGSTVYFEGRYCCKSGSYRWLAWTAAPFLSEKLIYIFARDITDKKATEGEIKSLNSQLTKRVNELSEINGELESFNYSISHDLRAPLRAMQGFAHMLVQEYADVLDDTGKQFAQRIVNSSMYMDTLLHDLLDYSRLTRSQLEPAHITLEGVLSEIVAQHRKDINDRSAELQIARPLLPVYAHLPTLRQVLSNLITNSMKFVDSQKIPSIKVWTEKREGSVRIWVEDNGIGIAKEHQDRVFGLFERLHTREYPGTGVGLALVRKGVERMGGCVGLESEKGKGSRFWVELSECPN